MSFMPNSPEDRGGVPADFVAAVLRAIPSGKREAARNVIWNPLDWGRAANVLAAAIAAWRSGQKARAVMLAVKALLTLLL